MNERLARLGRCHVCNGPYRFDPDRGVVACWHCGRTPGWHRPPTDKEGRDAVHERKHKLGGAPAQSQP